ncbi:DNA helicase PcrA [Effusibacillus lacus]|uniref:ATP-dependent DNA helicase n=1 Tax=Effusibacillus lacus TaxID=1348429 RepID=A0A292YQE6_9BACL|nr:DNA helicase PcrA [Effusibacillus lacus]TCS76795.1 DNA helicase-2/ATP-dependent DNA helicase PcrA [Effusibacillus lacus]GAX91129.1 DNA helicase PcrA [Effusibacillus lacus]
MISTGNSEAILQGLNPEQKKAVLHKDGPLLILAGAGSGKTSTLTRRMAYLIHEHRAAPWSILAITFTNKAAREMKQRVEKWVGSAAEDMWVSTFHSMCVRILRREIEKIGYTSSFTILDSADQLTAIKQCLSDLNLDPKKFEPRSILASVSGAKNRLQGPQAFAKHAKGLFEQVAAQVYERYQKLLRSNNSLDFDDLIMKTVELLETDPATLEYYQKRFQYIHVDEYQDTNHAQYKLIKLLAGKHRNLCVVGDSDQSIYGWRGADIWNILNFEKDYPDATVIKLEQNYRSTKRILAAANSVIENNTQRKAKNLWSEKPDGEQIVLHRAMNEHEEAYFIVDQIHKALDEGFSYRDCAVLYRTNAQSRVLEEVMLKSSIPYSIVGGIRFYERKEIKDVLAYLRLIANWNDDISLTRIINVPKRGIGDGTLDKIRNYAASQGVSMFTAMMEVEQIGLSGKIKKAIQDFVLMIRNLATQQQYLSVTELTEEMLKMSGYRAELKAEKTIEAETRLENLDEFLSVTQEFEQRYPGEGLISFLTDVALVADVDSVTGDADSVILMTLHSAKGLEFPIVFLAGMEEGVFPHSRTLDDPDEMEEERRLCYVGITRAEERLFLTTCFSRTLFGQTRMNAESRFLKEIPQELVEEFGAARSARTAGGFAGVSRGGYASSAGYGTNTAGVTRTPRTGSIGTHIPKGFGADLSIAWEIGDKVRHRSWGDGTIIETTGDGEDLELTVQFAPPTGVRKLLAKFAPITKE